jgi:hypothetical protein
MKVRNILVYKFITTWLLGTLIVTENNYVSIWNVLPTILGKEVNLYFRLKSYGVENGFR